MDKKLSIVLLGGTGFVGSAILQKICTTYKELEIRVLVRNIDKAKYFPDTVIPILGEMNHLPANLIPDNPHIIIHFATKQIDFDQTGFEKVNVYGTKALLKLLNKNTLGILYGSSMGVYGTGVQENITENTLPKPKTKLSKSLALAEELILDITQKKNIWGITLRPRFIIGKGDKFIIPNLLKLGKKKTRFISGNPKYSVIDIDDYVRIIIKLIEKIGSQENTPQQRPLNIAYKYPIGIQRIFEVFELPTPFCNIPLNGKFLDFLSVFNNYKLNRLSDKIKLIGLSHYGNINSAIQLLGEDPFTKDPAVVVQDLKRKNII